MRSIFSSSLLIVASGLSACAQSVREEDLARMLVEPSTRSEALANIASSGRSKLTLLLSWTNAPPAGVDRFELFVSLADAFGQMKAADAIPFLIRTISIQRWVASPNIWMKTAQVVEERLPGAAALIRIGPEASKALIRAYPEMSKSEDRLAAIFVISRISGVPEAQELLNSAIGEANLTRHWAQEGIDFLQKKKP